MLKFTLLITIAACVPCVADVITYTTAVTLFTDGDTPSFPPGFVALPGFNSSLGTLNAVNLFSTFSLDAINIEVGTDTQNANFSVVYTPSLGVSGPVPYTPLTSPPLTAPGSVEVANLSLTASGAGTASAGSAHCCDQPFGNYVAIVPVSAAATDSYDFVDLDPFTSDAQVAFLAAGSFGIQNASSLTGPTSGLGTIEYWVGSFTYDATITYTYAPTPEPSSVILMSSMLLFITFLARICPVDSRHRL